MDLCDVELRICFCLDAFRGSCGCISGENFVPELAKEVSCSDCVPVFVLSVSYFILVFVEFAFL